MKKNDGSADGALQTSEKTVSGKQKKQRRERAASYDDGRVIANMNVEGFSWSRPSRKEEKARTDDREKPTKKEQRAIMIAQLKLILPRLVIVAVSFVAVMLLCMLWLNGWKF